MEKMTVVNGETPANAYFMNKLQDNVDEAFTGILSVLGLNVNTWNSSNTYSIDDVVVYNYKLYYNLTGTNTSTTPNEDTTNWSETTLLVDD